MKLRLFNLISSLFCAVTLIGCASESIPDTPISQPATQSPATSTIVPTATAAPLPTVSFLPTISFGSPIPATPTIDVESPFKLVDTLDKILTSTDDRAYFRPASDGSIWMFTNQGIARPSDSGWKVYLSNYASHFVGIDSIGRAWFINQNLDAITPRAGGGPYYPPMDSISAWDGTKWTKYSAEEGWTSFYRDAFSPSMAELNGQIWVSTQQDLRVFDGSRWKVITPGEIGLQSPLSLAVKSFAEAEEIWVTGCYFDTPQPQGSDIIWYDGSTWQSKSIPEESGCLSTLVEHHGQVWMATPDSLWGFDRATKEWTHFALTQPTSTHITSLAINESGEPWFISLNCDSQSGCRETTVYHLQNEIWIPINPLPGIRFISLLTDTANQIWVWASDGVYQIVNNQPHLVSHLRVDSWTMDKAGKIWVIGRDPSVNNKLSLWVANP